MDVIALVKHNRTLERDTARASGKTIFVSVRFPLSIFWCNKLHLLIPILTSQ